MCRFWEQDMLPKNMLQLSNLVINTKTNQLCAVSIFNFEFNNILSKVDHLPF